MSIKKLVFLKKYYICGIINNLKFKLMQLKTTLTNLQPFMATIAAVGVLFLVYKAVK
jgi:hypothetical protein